MVNAGSLGFRFFFHNQRGNPPKQDPGIKEITEGERKFFRTNRLDLRTLEATVGELTQCS